MDVAYNSSVWQSSNTSHPLTINVMSNTLPCVFTFLCRKVGQQTGEPWDSCLLYSATQVLVTLCCLCPLAQLLHHSTGRGWVVSAVTVSHLCLYWQVGFGIHYNFASPLVHVLHWKILLSICSKCADWASCFKLFQSASTVLQSSPCCTVKRHLNDVDEIL